jgi:hypothetical protein
VSSALLIDFRFHHLSGRGRTMATASEQVPGM